MEHRNTDRGRRLLGAAAVVAVAGLGLGAPVVAAPGVSAPSTKDVELTSGTSLQSTWEIVNNAGTSNGLPAGGECPDPQIPGLGVSDAALDESNTNMNDAFDDGMLFFVDGHEMVSPTEWDVQTDSAEPSLNRVLTAGPTRLAGLDTTVEYRALPHEQVLRSLVTLANSSDHSVTVPFAVATNFGSDSETTMVGSSSGGVTFGDADRWLVTADDSTPSDAVNTSVLAGPGQVAATPHGSAMTVFECSDTQGVRTTFNVTLPAGSTRSLMFFNELSADNATAVASASRFSTNPAATSDLLLGLTEVQRATIVNWRLTQAQQPDGQIRKLHSKRYLGNNITNADGRHQSLKIRVHKGDRRTFNMRFFNDGGTAGVFSAHGTSSTAGLRVRYFAGGQDVTAQMTSAPGLLFSPAPGRFIAVKVKVKVLHSAAKRSHKFAAVTAFGLGNGIDRVDAVRAVLVVR